MTATRDTADRELIVTRDLDAPRALVFDAWTDVKHLANWWGPNGFTTTTRAIDVRPGGTWRSSLLSRIAVMQRPNPFLAIAVGFLLTVFAFAPAPSHAAAARAVPQR